MCTFIMIICYSFVIHRFRMMGSYCKPPTHENSANSFKAIQNQTNYLHHTPDLSVFNDKKTTI
jgi:hypothetical protein